MKFGRKKEVKEDDKRPDDYVYNLNNEDREPVKVTLKDLIAVSIAQFLILGPILLIAIFIFFLVLLFVSKVWLS